MTARQWVGLGVLLLSLGGAWTISRLDRSEPPAKLVVIEPVGIMGTVSTLAVMTSNSASVRPRVSGFPLSTSAIST